MYVIRATMEDLLQILQLQYIAYQSEAKIWNDFDIPPLKQTLQEIQNEYKRGIILKAMNENETFAFSIGADNKVLGSIGVFRQRNIHRWTAQLGYYIAEEY